MKTPDAKDKPIAEIIKEIGYVGGRGDYSLETRELRIPATYSKLYAIDPKVDFETIFLHKGVFWLNPFLVRCLKGFAVDPGNPSFLSLDGVLYSKDGTILIKAPEKKGILISPKTKIIGEASFKGSGMKSIAIPSGVSDIGRNAFENCLNLESIYIPKSVTKVGVDAFKGSPNLVIYAEREEIKNGWEASLEGCKKVLWGINLSDYAAERPDEWRERR